MFTLMQKHVYIYINVKNEWLTQGKGIFKKTKHSTEILVIIVHALLNH